MTFWVCHVAAVHRGPSRPLKKKKKKRSLLYLTRFITFVRVCRRVLVFSAAQTAPSITAFRLTKLDTQIGVSFTRDPAFIHGISVLSWGFFFPSGAIASTEVKLKLQEFLLSKKEPSSGGLNHSFPQKCW